MGLSSGHAPTVVDALNLIRSELDRPSVEAGKDPQYAEFSSMLRRRLEELRTLDGCTTPEELEAARAAYERAHPGVFVRKEQGLLLRADVPFPAADRYAAVNFASL